MMNNDNSGIEVKLSAAKDVVTRYIRKRKSTYANDYRYGIIPEAVLEEILTNATWAPTHKMTEPWRFIVLTGTRLEHYGDFMCRHYHDLYKDIPDETKREAKFRYLKEYPLKAACMVAIIMVRSTRVNIPEWEELAAVSCAVQNMAISATSFDIASYWATGGSAIDYVKTLGLAENETSLGLFFMGYGDESVVQPQKRRTSLTEKTTWLS